MGNRIKKKVSAYLEPDLYEFFDYFCKRNKLQKSEVISTLIRLLMTNGYDKVESILSFDKLFYTIHQRRSIEITLNEDETLETLTEKVQKATLEQGNFKLNKLKARKIAKKILDKSVNVTISFNE